LARENKCEENGTATGEVIKEQVKVNGQRASATKTAM
jgi:hypothetical protein